ncbi:hypothetical protein D3C72_1662450 [compost metagenome]
MPAHLPDGQGIERQVDQEERPAERPAKQVLEQEGHAHGTAGQQPRMGIEGDAQRDHGGAHQQGQGILPQGMTHDRGQGVRLRTIGFDFSHGANLLVQWTSRKS